jgi:transcriptional regulator GlxA family with amidase domain
MRDDALANGPPVAAELPSIDVDADRVFIADHNVSSSVGVTAGIGLALVIIEADHGAALARQVARELVIALPS